MTLGRHARDRAKEAAWGCVGWVWREKQAMAVVEVVCWLCIGVQIDAVDGNMEEERINAARRSGYDNKRRVMVCKA